MSKFDNGCLRGKGAEFCFAPQVEITVNPGNTFYYNQHFQNNTKINVFDKCTGYCDREFFIFNPMGEDKIWLKRKGRYTFVVKVETTPTIDTVVAIVNEGNEDKIPLYFGTSSPACLDVPECGSIVRLKNVGTVPIVLTPGTDTSVPLVKVLITYEGV